MFTHSAWGSFINPVPFEEGEGEYDKCETHVKESSTQHNKILTQGASCGWYSIWFIRIRLLSWTTRQGTHTIRTKRFWENKFKLRKSFYKENKVNKRKTFSFLFLTEKGRKFIIEKLSLKPTIFTRARRRLNIPKHNLTINFYCEFHFNIGS